MNRKRVLRVVRIGFGGLLLVIGLSAPFVSVDTKTQPVVHCGGPAVLIAVDGSAAHVPPSRRDDCQTRATDTVLGGIFFLALPGALLIAWPWLRRRRQEHRRGRADAARRDARQLRRRSWFAPPPVAMTIESPLAVQAAREQLVKLGNGGPAGSLRVRIEDDGYTRAHFVGRRGASFAGELESRPAGCALVGLARVEGGSAVGPGMLQWTVVGMAAVTLGVWTSNALRGSGNLDYLLWLGVTLFILGVGVMMRRGAERTFPLLAERLRLALAQLLGAESRQAPTGPWPKRRDPRLAAALIGLQLVAIALRLSIDVDIGIALLAAGSFGAIFGLGLWIAQSRRVHLDGDVVRAGPRLVDLGHLTAVHAHGAFMDITDGRNRIVLSSAYGRPEAADEARALLADPGSGAPDRIMDLARLVIALDRALAIVALDEPTAAALHRDATISGRSGPPPRFDPNALLFLGTLLAAAGTLVLVLVLFR